jgi:hypothetical protein
VNITNKLLDTHSCCVCLEPMKSAVSLNPCGHELDEGCALKISSSSTKQCPICRVDVDSFRPAYNTRQAVEVLLQNMQHSPITIQVNQLTGHKHTYKIERNSKAIDLFKLIFADTKIPPSRIKLLYCQKQVSHFSNLSDYIPPGEVKFNFYMTERLGHWTSIAEDYPLIFQKAVAEVGTDSEHLGKRFLLLYKQAIDQVMNS